MHLQLMVIRGAESSRKMSRAMNVLLSKFLYLGIGRGSSCLRTLYVYQDIVELDIGLGTRVSSPVAVNRSDMGPGLFEEKIAGGHRVSLGT